MKQSLILNLKNIPGRHTKRKILVIECDDWGGIRMPSKEVYNYLSDKGLPINSNRYNRYDTFESKEDLEYLFDVLDNMKYLNSIMKNMIKNMNQVNFFKRH
ncbi:MAG: hypothetical protein KBG40_04420 [Bacteroidales bacterium]|nr:hypothetical protein [Bacteroidales bacterium]